MSEVPAVLANLRRLHHGVLDFVFPPRCVGCRARGIWLCEACRGAASRVPPSICNRCGCVTAMHTCADCWKNRPKFDSVRATYFFEGVVRHAIHLFKYKGARHLLEPLSELMLESVEPSLMQSDSIVPVPLHERRLKERSYNQSELLAIEASKILGLDLVGDCLIRIRDTRPQMRLPASDRRKNMQGAFSCRDRRLEGKNVLLIDDVCTTGATLNECASALKKAGASSVRAICVARARASNHPIK